MKPQANAKMDARPAKRRKRLDRSTLLSVGMVAGAAAIAWFGLGARASTTPPAAGPQATLTASPQAAAAVSSLPAGSLPTRLVIPAAGVDTAIAEVGVTLEHGRPAWETAWRAAGHHIDSARPGQPGNVVITGHVSVADRNNIAVFRQLDRVNVGDIIEVQAGSDAYRYQVTGTEVVDPSATRLLRSDHTARVTLITCTPDLKHRLVVTGQLVS